MAPMRPTPPLIPEAAPEEGQDSSDTSDLFGSLDLEPNSAASVLDPTRRVFVNRNLRFDQIKQVGFDMDYTLAPYVKKNIEALSYQLTAERLVHKLGYPEELLRLRYDPEFVVRGLVIDKKLGNILKMNGHNYVGRAYHARRMLSKDERRELYRDEKIRTTLSRYYWLDSLFSLPEATLYADLIDIYEKELGVPKVAYQKIFDDIRASIDECHRDGSLKAIVKADLPQYFHADPDLPVTLHKLRSAGKRLFMLTNSHWDYTNAVMSYLLDRRLAEYPRWLNYFDVIIVGADKPGWFTENRDFRRVDPESGRSSDSPVTRFEPRAVYSGGNIRRFEKLSPPGGDQVLYVGDHIYGDIIRSKRDSMWRTALILEELEAELAIAKEVQRAQSDLTALEEHRARLDYEVTTLKLKIAAVEQALENDPPRVEELTRAKRQLRMTLDRKRRDLKAAQGRRDQLASEVDGAYNRYWGSVFKEGAEVSRFGEQVEDYACIYTSRVSNFLSYSPAQYFRAPRHWMSHEKL